MQPPRLLKRLFLAPALEPRVVPDVDASPRRVDAPAYSPVIAVVYIFEVDDDFVPLAEPNSAAKVEGDVPRDRRKERRRIDSWPEHPVLNLGESLAGREQHVVGRALRAVRPRADESPGPRPI